MGNAGACGCENSLGVSARRAIRPAPRKRMSHYKDSVENMKIRPTKTRIRDMEAPQIEEMLKKAGWTNLRWLPHSVDSYRKNIQWQLCGTPPDYKGPYEDYMEVAVYQIVDVRTRNHVRYCWKSHYRDKKRY
jgi:hypothetical protein